MDYDSDEPNAFDDWLAKRPVTSDREQEEILMSYFCAVIRPLDRETLLSMRAHLVHSVQAGPNEEIGLELIDGELALRELGQRRS